jgi:hypothetical protein
MSDQDETFEDAPEADDFHVIEAGPATAPGRFGAPSDISGRPVIALMGEFSAGKSTLSNLLIGTKALPVNVTATQLPPVWISYGDDAPYRVALDGDEYDIDLGKLDQIQVHDTAYIRIFHKAPLLEQCDIVDMPGISDPNMDADVWQRVIPFAKGVIWCTHATQAWRQSEAAVWGMLPETLYKNSLLLLTRIDRILNDRDRARLVHRVGRETNGLFRELLPISLVQALEAGEDEARWQACGAEAFTAALDGLIADLAFSTEAETSAQDRVSRTLSAPAEPARVVTPMRVRPRPLTTRPRSRVSRNQSGADPFAAL